MPAHSTDGGCQWKRASLLLKSNVFLSYLISVYPPGQHHGGDPLPGETLGIGQKHKHSEKCNLAYCIGSTGNKYQGKGSSSAVFFFLLRRARGGDYTRYYLNAVQDESGYLL